jgi:hypothetical protein
MERAGRDGHVIASTTFFGVEDNGLGLVRPFSSHSLLFFPFSFLSKLNSILL